jgi:hypothetical protein
MAGKTMSIRSPAQRGANASQSESARWSQAGSAASEIATGTKPSGIWMSVVA